LREEISSLLREEISSLFGEEISSLLGEEISSLLGAGMAMVKNPANKTQGFIIKNPGFFMNGFFEDWVFWVF
jgi:hypothetical protein